MSTILKALQRLEEDKSAERERSLEEQVVTPSTPARKSGASRSLVIGLALFVGLAAGAAALYLWPGAEQEVDTPQVAVAPKQDTPLGGRKSPAPASNRDERPFVKPKRMPPPEPAAPKVAVANEVEVVQRVERRPPSEAAAASRSATPEERAVFMRELERKRAESVAEADANPRPGAAPRNLPEPGHSKPKSPEEILPLSLAGVAPDLPKSTPPAIPKPPPGSVPKTEPPTRIAKAETPPEPTAVEPTPEPVAKSAPAPKPAAKKVAKPAPAPKPATTKTGDDVERRVVMRAEIPQVRLLRTIWHPDSARRVAVVEVDGESLELRLGDAVGPLVLEEVEPSGAFFDHDGVSIRHRVGE